MHHNEDYKRSGDPPLDLENGGSPHVTRQLLSSINCELSEEAPVVSNEGTGAGSGLIIFRKVVVPEDVSSGNTHSSSSVMPTATGASDRQTRDHSVLFSSAPNHTSVPQCGSANNEEMLVHPTIVAPGGTHSFDFNAVRSNNEESSVVLSPKKPQLSRNSSSHKQCRVCQQEKDEDLISLGCQCRGELAKTHRSCIDTWFRTKGSNRCEICQHVAVNVPPPESCSSASYWVWQVDPTFRGGSTGQERQRGCYSPLWVAFSILIGGLLLDVLISITLGVSALPVNIIIGVIVVLGLGTALRLAFEILQDWNDRRVVQQMEPNVGFGYNGAV